MGGRVWRFDIVNSAGTTKGALTIQPRDQALQMDADQQDWAMAKGRGTEVKRSQPPQKPALSGYTGFAMSERGYHALPIESIELQGDKMIMVVNSPRGLVIFRGTINQGETRFDGKVTYHNGQVYDMRGVKQVQPL